MNINFQVYYNQLSLIGSNNSPSGLRCPTYIVQNCDNAFQYFDDVTPPTGTTEPQFIVNKLLGGWFSASVGLCYDVYDNGGGGGPNVPRNLARNFFWGCFGAL